MKLFFLRLKKINEDRPYGLYGVPVSHYIFANDMTEAAVKIDRIMRDDNGKRWTAIESVVQDASGVEIVF